MADFFQSGAEQHSIGWENPDVGRLEKELEQFSEQTPIGLVLPCHYCEIETRALKRIIRELKEVT